MAQPFPALTYLKTGSQCGFESQTKSSREAPVKSPGVVCTCFNTSGFQQTNLAAEMVHELHSCGWQGSRQLELREMSVLYLLVTLSKFTLLCSAPAPAQWRDGPVVSLAIREESEHQCKIQLEFPEMCTLPELLAHILSPPSGFCLLTQTHCLHLTLTLF